MSSKAMTASGESKYGKKWAFRRGLCNGAERPIPLPAIESYFPPKRGGSRSNLPPHMLEVLPFEKKSLYGKFLGEYVGAPKRPALHTPTIKYNHYALNYYGWNL